jgi:hypothetical protein
MSSVIYLRDYKRRGKITDVIRLANCNLRRFEIYSYVCAGGVGLAGDCYGGPDSTAYLSQTGCGYHCEGSLPGVHGIDSSDCMFPPELAGMTIIALIFPEGSADKISLLVLIHFPSNSILTRAFPSNPLPVTCTFVPISPVCGKTEILADPVVPHVGRVMDTAVIIVRKAVR